MMALRTFTGRDGHEWNAWQVKPNGATAGYHERYRDGWVCFERVGGTGRCRLPLDELPPGWETLPDARVDLLRRVAEASLNPASATARFAAEVAEPEEDVARLRRSGAREAVGPDE